MCKLLRYPYDNEHKNIYILEMLATDHDMISSDYFDYDILSIVSRTREVLSIYSKIEWDKAKKKVNKKKSAYIAFFLYKIHIKGGVSHCF